MSYTEGLSLLDSNSLAEYLIRGIPSKWRHLLSKEGDDDPSEVWSLYEVLDPEGAQEIVEIREKHLFHLVQELEFIRRKNNLEESGATAEEIALFTIMSKTITWE